MKDATHNQFSIPLHLDVATAQAGVLRLLRSSFAKLCSIMSALLLATLLGVVQILCIGALDRLGIAPQHSFLALNLALIALLAAFTFYPLVARDWHSKHKDASAGDFAAAQTATRVSVPAEIVCKLLIIRRLNDSRNDQTQALQPFKRSTYVEQAASLFHDQAIKA